MEAARLKYMANQIADFFKSYPEDQAIDATEDHIRQFWDPRMRRDLAAALDADEAGLSPIALAAARRVLEAAKAG